MAPWAQQIIDTEQPRPEWEYAIFNFVPTSVPQWAAREGRDAPHWRDWSDFEMAIARYCMKPQSRIEEVQESRGNPRTLDWPSPTTGDVTSKSAINGQFVDGDVYVPLATTEGARSGDVHTTSQPDSSSRTSTRTMPPVTASQSFWEMALR